MLNTLTPDECWAWAAVSSLSYGQPATARFSVGDVARRILWFQDRGRLIGQSSSLLWTDHFAQVEQIIDSLTSAGLVALAEPRTTYGRNFTLTETERIAALDFDTWRCEW